MKIIFMGTPDFSAIVLEKLNKTFPVCAVVTGLDKPIGRGYVFKPSPLKIKAQELGIPVLQFNKVSKEGIAQIRALEPDIIVTAAFGQILSEEFLAIPHHGVLNVHASLLPKYRGASPIQWSVINGDKTTGITIMRTVKAVDAGDILLQKSVDIGAHETAGELFDRLAVLGGEAICEAVKSVEDGTAVFVPQDHTLATHCGMITKEDGKINFSLTAEKIDCFVRGMNPWPSAYFFIKDKRIKVFEVEKLQKSPHGSFGEVLSADSAGGLVVSCEGGAVRLKTIQPEGKCIMVDIEFLRGNKIETGTIFK